MSEAVVGSDSRALQAGGRPSIPATPTNHLPSISITYYEALATSLSPSVPPARYLPRGSGRKIFHMGCQMFLGARRIFRPGRPSCGGVLRLLAVAAMARPGHRFEAHLRDGLLARLADSVGPFPHADECLVNRAPEMRFVLTQAHTQFRLDFGIRYVAEIAFHASSSRCGRLGIKFRKPARGHPPHRAPRSHGDQRMKS